MKRAIATVVESTVRKDLPSLRFGESSDVRVALLEAGFKPGDQVEVVRLIDMPKAPPPFCWRACGRSATHGAGNPSAPTYCCDECCGALLKCERRPLPQPSISLTDRVEHLTAAANDLRARLQKLTLEQAAKDQAGQRNHTELRRDRDTLADAVFALEKERDDLLRQRKTLVDALGGRQEENARLQAEMDALKKPPLVKCAGVDWHLRMAAGEDALRTVFADALNESGCDGDLCMHRWHDVARKLRDGHSVACSVKPSDEAGCPVCWPAGADTAQPASGK